MEASACQANYAGLEGNAFQSFNNNNSGNLLGNSLGNLSSSNPIVNGSGAEIQTAALGGIAALGIVTVGGIATLLASLGALAGNSSDGCISGGKLKLRENSFILAQIQRVFIV